MGCARAGEGGWTARRSGCVVLTDADVKLSQLQGAGAAGSTGCCGVRD